MYEEYSMDGVEGLLDFFNAERTAKTIEDQIMTDDFGIGPINDYYRPYYVKYKGLVVDIDEGKDSETVNACKNKARVVALMFIDAILRKYELTVDESWIEGLNGIEIQGLTVIMYDFFVLHVREYMLEVFTKYIDANSETIAAQFEHNPKISKDASLPSFLKTMPEQYAVICANIYDVCLLILSNINEAEYINYIDPDNEIQPHIKRYFDEGRIGGNFVDILQRLFNSLSNGLKSYIGFELIAYIKRMQCTSENQILDTLRKDDDFDD